MRLIIIIFSFLTLVACGPEITKTDQTVDPDASIAKLLEVKEYQLAAEESLKLSKLYPDQAIHYQQSAVEIYLQAGDIYAASAILEDIRTDNDVDRFLYRILEAKIAIHGKDPVKALTLLNSNPPTGAPENLLIRYYETRSQAYETQRNFIEVVRNRITLSQLLKSQDELTQNYTKIWAALNKLNLTALQQYRSSMPELASWLELAIINQSMIFKPESLQLSISMWQEQYPDHPAREAIVRQMLTSATRGNIRPDHIALCLPFSGPLGMASQAIREGFLAAWFAANDNKPIINIYDSDAVNINSVYLQAVENGANFVVGPLEKNAIANLVTSSSLKVTTLALNQVDTPMLETLPADQDAPMPRLIQFGLSSEDEAREVADRARLDGHKRALVITPDNDKGQRLFEAFRSQWEGSGGKIMEQIKYPESTEEYKTWVKSLLNANSSDQRVAELRTRLNRNIRGETRLRSDADMVFMAATPVSARRIVPEFRFYQARIPIYSTSDIFSGVHNPQQDKDLDNVIFNHMPWVLDPEIQQSFLQQSINKHWSADKSAYRHFYALGIDAYQLISNLIRLATQNSVTYRGVTGELFLAENGHIQRRLMWAKFSQGTPVVIDQMF
ncbi:MAG: hypothetical protein HW386_431 [Gammaproteobacteria bacterium]|nr:hypothetical protein [Gammaproteobacteria bacterium]